MADILEKALDIALEKKDPKKKHERRKKRERSSSAKSRSNEISKNDKPATRYIASEVSERVHARANYQCEFRSTEGRRCSARTGLQIEHVQPFGIFHSNDERFLALLCPQHNALAAERVYGAAFIRRKIDERRRRRDARRNNRSPGAAATPSAAAAREPAATEATRAL